MNRFITGDRVAMKWVPAGGNGQGGGILNIKGMSLDEDCIVGDVTHTGTGGRTARICGKGDTKGTINASFDLDLKPYLQPTNIRAGAQGIAVLGFDPSFPIQIPAVCTKLHLESAIENEVRYSFDYAESVLSGVLVYPTS